MSEKFKRSFYDGTLDIEKAKEVIQATNKPIVYTYGFEFKNPTTHRVSITKEEAIEKIENEYYLDITEEDDCIHFNAFSSNDMW